MRRYHLRPPGVGPASRAQWADYAELFSEMARDLGNEWKIEKPSYETLPSHELELAVDCWCAIQAQNLGKRLAVPPEVRPWILARLAMALGSAMDLSVTRRLPAPALNSQSITQFLIGEWHGALREQWAEIGRLQWRQRTRHRMRIAVLSLVAAILIAGVIARWLR